MDTKEMFIFTVIMLIAVLFCFVIYHLYQHEPVYAYVMGGAGFFMAGVTWLLARGSKIKKE